MGRASGQGEGDCDPCLWSGGDGLWAVPLVRGRWTVTHASGQGEMDCDLCLWSGGDGL